MTGHLRPRRCSRNGETGVKLILFYSMRDDEKMPDGGRCNSISLDIQGGAKK